MRRAITVGLMTLALLGGSISFPVAAGAGGGCHGGLMGEMTQARATAGETFGAVIEQCAFGPTVLYVEEGESVQWVNKDVFDHTVTGAALSWGSEEFLAEGDTITQEFSREGVFPYYCLLHPSMVGAVVVGDPDPDAIALGTSSLGSSGVGTVSGESGDAAAPAQAPDSAPASDSTSTSVWLGTIVALGLAAAVAVVLLRRRRVEHGI